VNGSKGSEFHAVADAVLNQRSH